MAEVHLTFDNGPHPEGTPRVLEALARHDAHATFFVLGKHVATSEGRALAEAARDAGHRLGNHSYTHEVPLGEDPGADAVARELTRTQDLLEQIWPGPRWFRPFGGGGALGPHLLSPAAVDWLRARRATCVLWNCVPGDWKDAEGWVARALEDVQEQPTSVLVLHDAAPEAMKHLDRFLGELFARGHELTSALPAALTPVIEGVPQAGLHEYVRTE